MIAPGVVLTRESRTPAWRGTRAAVVDAVALGVAAVLLVGTALLAPAAYLLAALVVVGCEVLLVLRPNLPSFLAELSQAGPFWRGGMRGASAWARGCSSWVCSSPTSCVARCGDTSPTICSSCSSGRGPL